MTHLFRSICLLPAALVLMAVSVSAETCTTQSAMDPAVRDALVRSAESLATMTAANNADGLKAQTMPQVANDFAGIAQSVRNASAHLQGATFVPETVWLLDNSLKGGVDAVPQDAQFFAV